MKTTTENHRIAEIIVLELVNEAKFSAYINSKLKRYFKGKYTFKQLNNLILNAQVHHDNHTYLLQNQTTNVQYITAVNIIEHFWEQHNNMTFNRWDIPAEARYLYREEKTIKEVDMTEIELRVLAEYGNFANQASQKVESICDRGRTLKNIKDYFGMYKQGRWAWNTLRGKLEGHLDVAWQNRNDSNTALVDIFILKFYSKFFSDLYAKEFTRWDIPPQCRYLFEAKEFEETESLNTPYTKDTQAQSRIFREASEERFTQQFSTNVLQNIPKSKTEEIIMNNIETITFINGQPATELSDDQIFSLIAKTEKDIEKLEAIKEKPEKLTAKIKKMNESIKELVKIVDERD